MPLLILALALVGLGVFFFVLATRVLRRARNLPTPGSVFVDLGFGYIALAGAEALMLVGLIRGYYSLSQLLWGVGITAVILVVGASVLMAGARRRR